ncbi:MULTISPECIES: hypothetical protein [unclassified Streptomyces]|uniref:deazapurine DNA modification protein DpdA family protein n=1 Tax=unclassified Streptomyces TaxID=2593676 RepID=UPI0020CA342D|nr:MULTISPECIES: hypothetical protein [unclassified Streptomyces]
MTALLDAPVEYDACPHPIAYLCGHCPCDTCEDCGQCSGGGACACECMRAERAEAVPRFYLGTHMPNWLATSEIPLFISRNRLKNRRTFPRAIAPWALDSGGFTELQDHGRWTLTPQDYVTEVRRYAEAIGSLEWAAPQDWMCEEAVIRGGTMNGMRFHGTREARGLRPGDPEQDLTTAVRIHQQFTVDNYLELRALAPDLPFIPVLQGNQFDDYKHCAQLYADAGVDLAAAPVVGLGSVCRRQATAEIEEIVRHFAGQGLRLHGFGVKTKGLGAYADQLTSADSMAWSMDARRSAPLPGHTHKNCANCPDWAIRWHQRIVQQHLTPAA